LNISTLPQFIFLSFIKIWRAGRCIHTGNLTRAALTP